MTPFFVSDDDPKPVVFGLEPPIFVSRERTGKVVLRIGPGANQRGAVAFLSAEEARKIAVALIVAAERRSRKRHAKPTPR